MSNLNGLKKMLLASNSARMLRVVLRVSVFSFFFAASVSAQGSEILDPYVQICRLGGAGYYYIPGNNPECSGLADCACLDAQTDQIFTVVKGQPVFTESPLATRVSALETQYLSLRRQFNDQLNTILSQGVLAASDTSPDVLPAQRLFQANTAQDSVSLDDPLVEFVKICSFYGDGFYIPGTDSCLYAFTGSIQERIAIGAITRSNNTAARVSVLEVKFYDLIQQLTQSLTLSWDPMQMGVMHDQAVFDDSAVSEPPPVLAESQNVVPMSPRPIEYLALCLLYGNGYFYIPGSDTCLQPTTGITKMTSGHAVITGQTELAARIQQLEITASALEEWAYDF